MGLDDKSAAQIRAEECARGDHRWAPTGFCSFCRALSGFKPGIYRHYKGGLYTALRLVAHHDTRQPMVLYTSHTHGTTNVRPLRGWRGDQDGWLDLVGGKPRFEFVSDIAQGEPDANCVTTPNGGCVGGPCMHDARSQELALKGAVEQCAQAAKVDGVWQPLIHVSESGQVVDDEYPSEVREYDLGVSALSKDARLLAAARDAGASVDNPDTCGVCGKHFAECEADRACHEGDDGKLGPDWPACAGARIREALR